MRVTNLDPRIGAVADAFDELHAFVATEPELTPFVRATSVLASLARDVRSGLPVAVVVPNDRTLKIPTRELAERVLSIVNRAPGPLGHEGPETLRTMAILHNNLARAVVYAIITDYPDLMSH
jgi:hypothetical protein